MGSGSGELAYDFRGSGALICAREGSRLDLAAGSKGEVALALVARCPGRQGQHLLGFGMGFFLPYKVTEIKTSQ